MQRLNVSVSQRILDAIHASVEGERDSIQKLAQAVAELSKIFTKERARLSVSYLDNSQLGTAYLQYFLPVNLAKIQLLLAEMPTPEGGESFSVLDLGSGPGTGALAVLDWCYEQASPYALSVTAIDGSAAALGRARQLWDRYSQAAALREGGLRTYEVNLEQRAALEHVRQQGPFDLILATNCLNELYADAQDPIEMRAGLVTEALSLMAPNGTMMIVEPALRETSRALHQVRDRLLQEKRCTVYSPCVHENACPAMINPHDWCHEERIWDPPAVIKEIDEQVGFIKDALKFSYLLLRKDGKTIVERRPDMYRVVSELREMKGEKRAWLCNEQGRQEIGRQDRLASTQNQAFDQWHRGAIVQIERIARKERGGKVSSLGRIEQDAMVQLIRPI
ncbi:MAG TPA: small ribosomal subunit Rsm22 family protein [Nitrospira sp.]|nr:small ribosomal subunit Rsm22 family protein [Nitrospira sp.]